MPAELMLATAALIGFGNAVGPVAKVKTGLILLVAAGLIEGAALGLQRETRTVALKPIDNAVTPGLVPRIAFETMMESPADA